MIECQQECILAKYDREPTQVLPCIRQGRGKAVCDGNHEDEEHYVGYKFIGAKGSVKRNTQQLDIKKKVGQRSQRSVLG